MLSGLPALTILAGDVITAAPGADSGIAITVRNRCVDTAGAFTVTVYSGATITDTNPIVFTMTVASLAVDGQITVDGLIAG